MRPVGVVRSQRVGTPYFIASVFLLLVCNALPAIRFIEQPITFSPRYQTMAGFEFTLLGWMGPLGGHFGWYANPLMVIAWICLLARWQRAAQVLATLACFMVMSSLSLIVMGLPKNEANIGSLSWDAFLPGYYLWVLGHAAGWIATMRPMAPR